MLNRLVAHVSLRLSLQNVYHPETCTAGIVQECYLRQKFPVSSSNF